MKQWDELQKEEVVRKCPVRKVFLKISQISQENTFVRVSFTRHIFFQLSGLTSSNISFYMTNFKVLKLFIHSNIY